MYTLLSTLGSEQISYERCLASTTSEQTPNTDINLASSSPSAASHSLEITAKQLEQDTPNICLPNDSSGSEDISRLTMAETAEQEWKFIERVVKAILPPRVRRVDALSPVPASPIPPARNEERPDERKQDRSTCTRKLGASAQ